MPLVAWSPKTQASRTRARAAFVKVEVQVPGREDTNLAKTSWSMLSLPFVFDCQRAFDRAGLPGPARRGTKPRRRKNCGADRSRNDDIQLAQLALYQLSYSPITGVGGWWA